MWEDGYMANTHRKTVRTDDRRRITLGALAEPGETYIATKAPDGTITLHPADVVPRNA